MRIAVNALFLEKLGSGTGQYTQHLLSALGRVDAVNEYVVLSRYGVNQASELPATFTRWTSPVRQPWAGGQSVGKLIWEQCVFPAAARRLRADLMHIPHLAPPLYTHGLPTVVTVHDLIGLRLPLYQSSPALATYTWLVTQAARRATLIITVSQYSKADILELLRLPPDRVRVVPEAPASYCRRILDARQLQVARDRYGLSERFILCTAGLDQRKNISTLVKAFAAVFHEIGDRNLQLFVSGDPGRLGSSRLFPDWRPLAASLGVADNILCAFVAEEDKPLLYSATDCFVYPSLYEGFGLPPLEAMACGAPVVCSERTSLPEVIGEAGILVNPQDVDRLSAAMHRVLLSPELREDLRARGQARAGEFSWDKIAVATGALYAEAAKAAIR